MQKGKAGYSLTLGDTEEVFGALIELGKNDYKEKKDYLCGRDIPEKANYMIVAYRKVTRGSADYIDNSFIKLDTTEFYYKNGDRINHIDDVDGVDGFTGIDSFFNFFIFNLIKVFGILILQKMLCLKTKLKRKSQLNGLHQKKSVWILKF